jgi:hypothetical protein
MNVKRYISGRFLSGGILMGLVAVSAAFMLSGCEEATGTRSLTVDPAFVDLTGSSTTSSNTLNQTFSVTEDSLQDLSLPLEWRVSNPGLGSIASSGGRSASYVRSSASGDNSIFVVDQFGAEGIATVRQ